jgi:hypothetical protein
VNGEESGSRSQQKKKRRKEGFVSHETPDQQVLLEGVAQCKLALRA